MKVNPTKLGMLSHLSAQVPSYRSGHTSLSLIVVSPQKGHFPLLSPTIRRFPQCCHSCLSLDKNANLVSCSLCHSLALLDSAMIGGIDTVMAPLGGGRLSIIGQGNQLDYRLRK